MLSTGPQITQLVSIASIPNSDGICIEIFFHGLEQNHYKCWLGPKQALPMIYVDDVIDATMKFLKAPKSQLKRQVYNLAGISFTPEMLAREVEKLMPGFTIEYEPCARRAQIAEQWPQSIDDTEAREDWGWKYEITMYDLAKKILDNIDDKYKQEVHHRNDDQISSSENKEDPLKVQVC